MQIYWSLDDMGLDLTRRSTAAVVATLGTFDGVHQGHRALLQRVASEAQTHGGTATAIVFAPHPQQVLRGQAPVALTSLSHRLNLIAACGIESVAVVCFDEELAAVAAPDFAQQLCDALRPQALILGYDFRFGHRGAGSIETFRSLARNCPALLEQVPGCQHAGQPISSSRIRKALAGHALADAAMLLGRPYSVRGTVVPGQRRGRSLGYPTANLRPETDIAVPTGIYAGTALLRQSGERHTAAISLGHNPTFEATAAEPVLEIHLLDFDRDIYGEELEIEFADWLRGEQRFESVEALKAQIGADVERCRQLRAAA